MKQILIIVLAILALSSCDTTNSLYSWHDYENATYQYNKKSTDELKNKMLEQYKKMINIQNGERHIVPPGLYAEYGYQLCKLGKKEEGLDLMKKEITLYPESEKYISRIIKQLEK